MYRMATGAAACALALAGWRARGRADGAVSSLSDLDKGAQQWHLIAPNDSADKHPADPLTTVGTAQAPRGRGVTRIGDHLSIEAPPPPPKKPVASLWFTKQPAK